MIGLINAEEGEEEEQFNMDIDEVIKRARVAKYSFTKGSYSFAKGNFNTICKEDKVMLNDPDFWKKVFKNSETVACKIMKQYNKDIKSGLIKLVDS